MTTPDPRDSSPAALPDLIKAFTGLPPLLGYGGLVLVAAMIILSISGTLPDILLAVPIVALIAFLIYAFMGHRFALQTRQAEMRHEEKMVELRAEERPSPVPTEVPGVSPSEGQAPPPAGRIAAGEWERRYLEHLLHLCGYPPSMALVDIREAGLGGQKLALERIFTTLDVPNPEGRREPAGKPPFLEPPDEGERRQREAVLTAMSRPENKRLVLLGAPGAGKSTLVSYLTLCLAGDHLRSERVNQSHLQQHGWQLGPLRLWPVRVILREYAARGLSQGQGIWDFMAADLSRPAVQLGGYVPYLKERLNEEGGILLLDGLDEVDKASQVRQALKTNVELFARNFPKVRVVVTSRPYAYGSGWELSGFQVTRLLPFSDEQIQAFIEQWYTVMGQQDGTLGPERAKTYREGLLRQVKNNRNLRELARHPLLLTMMVYIHRGREGGALPQRREELYRLCVILLLDLWRRSKTIPGQETKTLAEVLGVDTERLLEALAEVAFTAHRDQPDQEQTADIPGEILSGKLHKYKSKESRVSVDEIIEYVRDRAGLLEDHGRNADDTDDVYRFPHRTFQEYLAGLHLLKQNFPYDLARYASQDPGRWREALLLAAASQRTVPFTVWSLVAALCQQPPPRTLSDSQSPALWGAFLAGRVLVETELIHPEKAQNQDEQYTRRRVQLWQEVIVRQGALPPPDRALAGEALAALGDDRPGVLLCDEMRLCFVPPGDFWMGDEEKETKGHWNGSLDKPYWLAQYPVTVAQFRQFVTESRHKPYWDDSLRGPDNWPVAWLNWYDTLAFCDWLDKRWRQGGWLPAGYRVTLPSEAEWEKAARGGRLIPTEPQVTTAANLPAILADPPATRPNERNGQDLSRRTYPWGDEPEQDPLPSPLLPSPSEGEGLGVRVYRANNESARIGGRCAVGSFPAGLSPHGCLDMSGQVWEWTRSFWGKSYPYRPTREFETIDPRNKERMVLRGGAYYGDQNGCSVRYWDYPHVFVHDSRGVRVCVSPFTSGL